VLLFYEQHPIMKYVVAARYKKSYTIWVPPSDALIICLQWTDTSLRSIAPFLHPSNIITTNACVEINMLVLE